MPVYTMFPSITNWTGMFWYSVAAYKQEIECWLVQKGHYTSIRCYWPFKHPRVSYVTSTISNEHEHGTKQCRDHAFSQSNFSI